MGQDVTPPRAAEYFFTTEEVAARYRTSPATVRWWRQAGNYGPKGIKVGRRVLYSETEIERFERALAADAVEASDGVEEKLPGHLDAA